MKKLWLILGLLLCVSFVFLFVGCGTTTEETTTTTSTTTTSTTATTLATGMALRGVASNLGAAASGLIALAVNPTEEGNPSYPNKFLTPESYAVGIWKFEIMKGLSDTTPYTVKEFAALSSEPVHFLLSSVATSMATNPDYPVAGTYTYNRPTLGYLEMEFAASDVSFGTITKFRLYTSTVTSSAIVSGTIQDGDVLVLDGGTWKWIDSADASLATTRPASPAQDEWFSTAQSPDPFAPTDAPMNSVVIPSSPTSEYTATISFDVSNTLFFDDVDSDGVFEPATDDVEQGGQGTPSWFPGPPSISLSITQ